jgi:hypothetical protein
MNITWEILETGDTAIRLNERMIAVIERSTIAVDMLSHNGEAIRLHRETNVPVDRMTITVRTFFRPLHTMIPAVSYDGNPWGNDHEYKGYSYEGKYYTFAHHRSSIPGASVSWSQDAGIAIWTEYEDGGCASSLTPNEDNCIHRILWPEEEGPRVLFARKHWGEAFKGSMEPRKSFTVWIMADVGNKVWKGMLSHVWSRIYRIRIPSLTPEEVWYRGVKYAKNLYTEEKDGFKGFSIGYNWDNGIWHKRDKQKYEIGWCGQNASYAVSLMYDAQMNSDNESLDIALAVLDSWLKMARSVKGYLLTRYDPPGMPIDACNLGTAGIQFFEAASIAKILGKPYEEYEKAAFDICSFAINRQRLDGGIGMTWDQDGMPIELRGTAGGFFILPLAEAFRRTKNGKYNTAAVRAYTYYYNEFARNGFGTAGALDTYCIDKESVIPLLKGGILMYKATGFRRYIDFASEAAWYLSTWQWHHSVKYPEDSVLAQMKYDTFGGTAVSTSHNHIDPFALSYVADLIELSSLTGELQWKEKALAIWVNGVQGISDGTDKIMGKAARPIGSQDEGYLHTRWGDPDKKDGYFSVSQWLVAWPGAFRLECLRGGLNWNIFK